MALGALTAALLMSPARAYAHAELASADPAPNSVVGQVVERIELTFSDRVILFGPGVVVNDGARDITTTPTIKDKTVTAVLGAPIGAGTYDVTWNIESSDGHRATASYSFSVAAGVVAPAAPSTTATTGVTSTSMTSAAIATGATTTTTAADATARGSSKTRVPNWVPYAVASLAIVGIAAAIGGIARVIRNRRRG